MAVSVPCMVGSSGCKIAGTSVAISMGVSIGISVAISVGPVFEFIVGVGRTAERLISFTYSIAPWQAGVRWADKCSQSSGSPELLVLSTARPRQPGPAL